MNGVSDCNVCICLEVLTPSWFSRPVPAGLGLNSPEPPVGIWLATASMLLLVEDIVVCDWIWEFQLEELVYDRREDGSNVLIMIYYDGRWDVACPSLRIRDTRTFDLIHRHGDNRRRSIRLNNPTYFLLRIHCKTQDRPSDVGCTF